MLRPFWIALQFLTRIPTPRFDDLSATDLGRSMLLYPLVGGVIGVLMLCLAGLLWTTSTMIGAAVILAAWVMITGALHIDGLADSVDAWIGGHGSRDRTLAIMKDPYCGPMAVTAVVLMLLLKFAALQNLLDGEDWVSLLWVPVVGRAAALALLLWTPYARPEGIGAVHAQNIPRTFAYGVLGVVAILVMLMGWMGFEMLIAVVAVWFLLRWMMMQRLGGTTGDTAGASIEITETAALLVLAL
jgi:adenosylcobinamide-GDP ribazoletransferase